MMNGSPASKELVMQSCKELQERLCDNVTWSWDEFTYSLLAEFSVDHEQRVLMAVKSLFPHTWDRKSVKKAPPFLQHRAGRFGRLQDKQLLLTQDQTGGSELMLAWWPWGHGATVSMRIFRVNMEPYSPPSGLTGWLKRLVS